MKLLYPFEKISKLFDDNNIFFTTNGQHRHKSTDMMVYESGVAIEPYCAFLSGANIFSMGSFSYSWSNLPINIRVGRYCSIARGVAVLGTRHPIEWLTTSSSTYDKNFVIFKKFATDIDSDHVTHNTPSGMRRGGIVIGDDVWISANVVLKGDLYIGTGSVIAANSVVVKDVPPYAIVGGNPARIIKYRFSDYQIMRLLESRWWDYAFTDVQSLNFRNVDSFCDEFEISKNNFQKYSPNKLILKNLEGA